MAPLTNLKSITYVQKLISNYNSMQIPTEQETYQRNKTYKPLVAEKTVSSFPQTSKNAANKDERNISPRDTDADKESVLMSEQDTRMTPNNAAGTRQKEKLYSYSNQVTIDRSDQEINCPPYKNVGNSTMFTDSGDLDCFIPDEIGRYYIVEAFNRAGKELVITSLQVSKEIVDPTHDYSFKDELCVSDNIELVDQICNEYCSKKDSNDSGIKCNNNNLFECLHDVALYPSRVSPRDKTKDNSKMSYKPCKGTTQNEFNENSEVVSYEEVEVRDTSLSTTEECIMEDLNIYKDDECISIYSCECEHNFSEDVLLSFKRYIEDTKTPKPKQRNPAAGEHFYEEIDDLSSLDTCEYDEPYEDVSLYDITLNKIHEEIRTDNDQQSDDRTKGVKDTTMCKNSEFEDTSTDTLCSTTSEADVSSNPDEVCYKHSRKMKVRKRKLKHIQTCNLLSDKHIAYIRSGRSKRINLVIEELIQTEERYVDNLRRIVKDYKPYLECASKVDRNLNGKAKHIFVNIDSIYYSAVRFCEKLQLCGGSINKIGRIFFDFRCRFEMYSLYTKEHHKAMRYMVEFQKYIDRMKNEAGNPLDLGYYLIKPIERLGKYVLLLKRLLESLGNPTCEKDKVTYNSISNALNIIRKEMDNANNAIVIDSIKNCPIDLSIQGAFLMRQSFHLQQPWKGEATVFLFEKVIVFTVKPFCWSMLRQPKNSDEFMYKSRIFFIDLHITNLDSNPRIFYLSDFTKNARCRDRENTYILEAKTKEIKDAWTTQITQLLWQQLESSKEKRCKETNVNGSKFR